MFQLAHTPPYAALLFLLLACPAWAAGPVCKAPALSDEQVKERIAKERASRSDLPGAFPKSEWKIRRQGCHYVALESLLPATPEANHIFKLNQHGVIVDVTIGNSLENPLQCPGKKALSEAELARIVAEARATRDDLPPPFSSSTVRIDHSRCTYSYFEYRSPRRPGDYQVFLIDAFGEVMEVQRSQPY